jgi:molybdopterin-containing oxidoreductase family membrane subunit
LENPYIPIPLTTPSEWAHYIPSGVEWAITAAALAMFILLYVLFAKLFPIVSIWETREETHVPMLVPSRAQGDTLAMDTGD